MEPAVQANLGLRLVVLRVLVFSLIVTLGTRLYYLQVLDQQKLTQTATKQHTREVVLAAPRGAIVDDRGRPLVTNRVSLVVSVNRSELLAEPDRGAAVLRRLAPLVHIPAAELAKRITPCERGVPKPCWNGSPYQPVPVLTDTTPDIVLRIAEHREDFPGVSASAQTLRQYPGRSLAAHALGYVGPVTQEELDNAAAASQSAAGRAGAGNTELHRIDLVGRSGLEASYDRDLRGKDGIRSVSIDNRGTVLRTQSETPPVQGNTLVTSIDWTVQALTEKALAGEIAKRRTEVDKSTGRRYAAPSGAAVVLDPRTGRIIALASYPTYDPTAFVGGISQRELAALTSPRAGVPLVSRAVQGQFAPGSTFKLVSASAEVSTGRASLSGSYPCPGSLRVGNRTKTNFEGKGIAGTISMAVALAKSCDTFFYAFAMRDWLADQARVDGGQRPVEALQRYARAYGFGTSPELDLPDGEQTSGRMVDRAFLRQRWEANKGQYCADGKRGYPEVASAARRTFLTRLAQENCTDGWRFRMGDAADLAIGQGETTVSPLQLAVAYAALVNGGTVWEPTIGRAVLGPDGRVIREIKAKARGRVPVSGRLLAYIRDSLAFTPQNGVSGSVAFTGFPLDKVLVGGKTGTAEVFGKQDTSWFASWAPAGRPRFVVVGMIEQAGLGARAAAPMVRQIYDGIFGLAGKPAALPRGVTPTAVPRIAPHGAGRSAGRGAHPGTAGAQGTTTAPTGTPVPSPTPGHPGAVDLVTPAPSATVRALSRRRRSAGLGRSAGRGRSAGLGRSAGRGTPAGRRGSAGRGAPTGQPPAGRDAATPQPEAGGRRGRAP
jgi:penicillin-binding protein 2